MGRIRCEIEMNGRKCWTLFDSGARNTYVTEDITKSLNVIKIPKTVSVALGGKSHKISETCTLIGYIEGKMFFTTAGVIDEIGEDEERKTIDILFGALAMQQWGIRLLVDDEKLDLTNFPKEFLEF